MSEESMDLQEAIQVLAKRIETLEYLNTHDNVMRTHYRELTGAQKGQLKVIKGHGLDFRQALDDLGISRELSLAKTYLEEAVMWAARHIEK